MKQANGVPNMQVKTVFHRVLVHKSENLLPTPQKEHKRIRKVVNKGKGGYISLGFFINHVSAKFPELTFLVFMVGNKASHTLHSVASSYNWWPKIENDVLDP